LFTEIGSWAKTLHLEKKGAGAKLMAPDSAATANDLLSQ